MRVAGWIATLSAAGAAVLAVYIGHHGVHHVGLEFLGFFVERGAPAVRGLVREEDVHPDLPDGGEDDLLQILADLRARGVVQEDGLSLQGHFRAFSDWLSKLVRLPKLLRQSGQLSHRDQQNDGVRPPVVELRAFVNETLAFVSVCLKLIGMILVLVLPVTIITYFLLGAMFYVPFQMQFMLRALDILAKPLDRLLLPLLCSVARLCGLGENELLCQAEVHSCTRESKAPPATCAGENVGAGAPSAAQNEVEPVGDVDGSSPNNVVDGQGRQGSAPVAEVPYVEQVTRRARRVLFGMLVINVAGSALALVALAILVALLHAAGALVV